MSLIQWTSQKAFLPRNQKRKLFDNLRNCGYRDRLGYDGTFQMIVFTCPSGLFSALSVSLRMEENHTPLSLPRLSTWYTFPDWNSLVSKKCTFLSGTALMQISLFLMLVICNYFLHMLRRSQGRYIVYLEVNCYIFHFFCECQTLCY